MKTNLNLVIISLDQSLLGQTKVGDTLLRFKEYQQHTTSFSVLVPTTQKNSPKQIEGIKIIAVTASTVFFAYLKLLAAIRSVSVNQNTVIVANDPVLGVIAKLATFLLLPSPKIQINIFGLHTLNPHWLRAKPHHFILKLIHEIGINTANSIRTDNFKDKDIITSHYHLDPNKIVVVPIVPSQESLKKFITAKVNLKIKQKYSPTSKLIFTISNLLPNKDLATLINSLAQIDQTIKFHCLIAGSGPQLSNLTKLTKLLGLTSQVTFLGSIDYQHLPAYFKSADLFVLSSYQEGLPRTLMEAALAKTPIITTNINGAFDLITDHQSGLIVPIKDPSALSKAISFVLTHPNQAKNFTLKAYSRAYTYLIDTPHQQTLINSWINLITK